MTTPNRKYPYPQSSESANDGANDIKALALAVDADFFDAYRTVRGYVNAAPFNGGRYAITIPPPLAGTVPKGAVITGYWGGTTGSNSAPLVLSVETMTATQVGLIALMPPRVGQSGSMSEWYSGTCGVAYLIWG